MVQFRQGFAYINNNVDSKRHIIIRTANNSDEWRLDRMKRANQVAMGFCLSGDVGTNIMSGD